MTTVTLTNFASSDFADRLASLKAEIATKLAARKLYRQTYNELQDLTSRDLADLGIHRSNIRAIAFEAAYGAK